MSFQSSLSIEIVLIRDFSVAWSADVRKRDFEIFLHAWIHVLSTELAII